MKNSESKSGISDLFLSIAKYMKDNTVKLLAFLASFLLVVILLFVRISLTNTISTYNINDYEVGQISDITVTAMKNLPADSENPVSVEKGEKVVKKGFPITEEGYAKLKRMSASRAYIDYRSFADSILFLMLLGALYFFLFSRVCLGKKCSIQEIITGDAFFVAVFACTVLASRTMLFSSPYTMNTISPIVFCTFFMAILFGQMDAISFALVSSFGVLCASGYQLIPFIFSLCVSLASSRIVRRITKRIDLVSAAMLLGILSPVFLFVIMIIFNGPVGGPPTRENYIALAGVMLNGFMSGILCLGFLTPLEYLLNTASVFRLMDLSDTNAEILKQMSLTASGTYNHSIMVANLSENACNKIGANALLARVGSLYHDIGKMDTPEFFTENQSNTENIHNSINPSLSVTIIKNHVRKGVEKAKTLHLPASVVDIIAEHHGNGVLKPFYINAQKTNPNANPGDYSYTGNPPSTRESGVVMLADTVEAACKSLDKPSASRIDKFVRKLVRDKIDDGMLNSCDLTFKDISIIEETFIQILIGHYHSRVKYPDQKEEEEKPAEAENAAEAEKSAEAEPKQDPHEAAEASPTKDADAKDKGTANDSETPEENHGK
ncbi:MAG: HDIG domain-containing protein [Treponema sp.]|nr:HDIG domain-containing protein [Treponema sp.]